MKGANVRNGYELQKLCFEPEARRGDIDHGVDYVAGRKDDPAMVGVPSKNLERFAQVLALLCEQRDFAGEDFAGETVLWLLTKIPKATNLATDFNNCTHSALSLFTSDS